MTDSVKGFTVMLDKDIRIDDIKYTVNAIKMIKGVIKVTPLISEAHEAIEGERVKQKIRSKLYDFIEKEL